MSEDLDDRWGHRPHLDGLRAVAVYLVVAFHARSGQLEGGFIGVDVFFVLSGYLVTRLLVRDVEQEGRIRFGRFYARRVRRLLPAALVTLVATAFVFPSIGNGIQVEAAVDDIRAAALYVANWHFIARSTDYFAEDVAASPVLHYWSLSIEEQFYLVWPLAFAGLHAVARRAGRRSHRLLQLVLAALAVASAATALTLVGSQPERAYFGTDTRAYQLLAGALLALSPGVAAALRRLGGRSRGRARIAPLVTLGALAAIVLLATPAIETDPVRRGVLATMATLVLLVSVEAADGGLVRRALSWAPIAYLGRISYGTYLWHWLVILVIAHHVQLSPLAMALLAAAVATGLASLSNEVLELPIRTDRRLDGLRGPVIAAGAALSLVVALVVAPRASETRDRDAASTGLVAMPAAAVDDAVTDDEVFAALRDNFDYDACPSSAGRLCVLAEGDGPTAVVVGDSHAGVWADMLTGIAEEQGMTLLGGLLSYCPWPRGIRYAGAGPNCFEDQAELYDELIPAADPDIVFLAHRSVDDPNDPLPVRDIDLGLVDGPARDDALSDRVQDTVAALVADGRVVVLFEPIPVAPTGTNPLGCLSATTDVLECRFVAGDGPSTEDLLLRELAAEDPAVVSIDADRLACPYLPICDPVLEGSLVWRDGNHLTSTHARFVAPVVALYLVQQGVLEP